MISRFGIFAVLARLQPVARWIVSMNAQLGASGLCLHFAHILGAALITRLGLCVRRPCACRRRRSSESLRATAASMSNNIALIASIVCPVHSSPSEMLVTWKPAVSARAWLCDCRGAMPAWTSNDLVRVTSR